MTEMEMPEQATPDYDQVWTEAYGGIQDSGSTHRYMRRIVDSLLKQLDYKSMLDV